VRTSSRIVSVSKTIFKGDDTTVSCVFYEKELLFVIIRMTSSLLEASENLLVSQWHFSEIFLYTRCSHTRNYL
jgi:hypothetical protein